MLRVITLNLNGIRSAAAKGFLRWLARQSADCVCMQEIKVHETDLPDAIAMPGKLTGYFDFAHKKGYSGVGMYCQRAPDAVTTGIGSREFDPEGRFLRADFGKVSVVSLYLPSGSSSAERQQAKFRFMDEFMPVLRKLAHDGRELILCGDWNIAHKEIDLKNWRSNRKNSGFLPEERAWLSQVFEKAGWVDVFRRLDPAPSSTRGGRTAARPGRRTWAGASTTRSPLRGLRRRRSGPRSTRRSASRTTPRSRSTTTGRFERGRRAGRTGSPGRRRGRAGGFRAARDGGR
jgi:exodeoxyribonuclease-3